MSTINNNKPEYRGRFAPSPTGPLHSGSLLAAVGSYLQAKKNNGKWLVRIEDLDPPREVKGAATGILKTLEAHGLFWDEPVVFQSQRSELYEAALDKLASAHVLFRCNCSRKSIKENGKQGPLGYIYNGNCRNKDSIADNQPFALRLLSSDEVVCFNDHLQGQHCVQIQNEIGDVVLKRADQLYAYHLAVVVDDQAQKITQIVRGYDLFDCTSVQICLQQILDYPTPSYLHLPVLVNANAEKLSKQTKATAVNNKTPEHNLITCLHYLNQNPPASLAFEKIENILNWARANWTPDLLNVKRIYEQKLNQNQS